MSDHPNAAVVRRSIDALNAGDVETMLSLVADDVVWYEIGRDQPVRGRDALAARFQQGAADFTISGKLHDVTASDDHVVALVEAEADRGGRHLSYRAAEICHVKDGKITERWSFSDDTAAIIAFFR